MIPGVAAADIVSKGASKGIDVVQNLATQRVIGYSRTVTKKQGKRNPKVVQENLNIGIQAWELGFILLASGIAAVGAGAYYYFTGSNASNSLSELMKIPMLPGGAKL